MKKSLLELFLAFLGLVSVVAVSWITTCAIFKLITMCFEAEFTWKIATGVWLSLFLLSTPFNGKNKK